METNWRRNYLRYKTFFLNMLSQYREHNDWKAYLEILLSLGTISIFSIFALRPTVLTIAELIKQIDEKQTTLQRMDDKIQNLSKAQILYDSQRGNITLLEQTAVPKSINADVFARQIEGLSLKHQVVISSFSLGESVMTGNQLGASNSSEAPETDILPPTGSEVLNSNFTLTLNSGIDQYLLLTGFLTDFRNLRMPPKIEGVRFETGSGESLGEINLTLSLTGKILYLP